VPPTPPPTQGPLSGPGGALGPIAAGSPSPSPSPSPAAARRGGSFTEADTTDAVSFHPYLTTDVPSSSYQGFVYGGEFWSYNPDSLQPEPEAAESWTISPDKLVYTFKLRSDLKWSDGTPMTSADYKFAFDQAVVPEHRYPYISNLELIESYETTDPRTVVITMKEPITIGLEATNAVTPLPKHIWEKLDWSDPSKNPEIMAPSVSSGPFKLKEWQRDNFASFEANDLYYKGRPLLDSYTIRIVPSQEIAYQMLKKGEVDFAPLTPDNYDEAKALPSLTMYEWWPAAAQWNYLGFNLRRPHFQDVEARRAISYAIDRKAIAERIQNNLAQPNHSPFPPTSWVHNPNVPKYEFDPEQARQMLETAGWKAGPDGMRQVDGKRIKLRILFGPVTSKTAERVATVTQQWLREVGVDSEIQGLEWGAYLSTLKQEPFDWDLNVGAWRSTIEPHWMNQIWLEESIPELNHVGYVNKKVEELFDQGSKEFDVDKRKVVYQDIQQLITTDAPYVFLTYGMSYQAINNRIGGIRPTRLGIGYNLEQWHVK
jgi:peptide/nickel transport system substrate-binding protein